jgi:hypothetical protein
MVGFIIRLGWRSPNQGVVKKRHPYSKDPANFENQRNAKNSKFADKGQNGKRVKGY